MLGCYLGSFPERVGFTLGWYLSVYRTSRGTPTARDVGRWPAAAVVAASAGRGHGRCRVRRIWLDAQERVAHTDQQPARRRVLVVAGAKPRSRPERHQAGRAKEPAEGTGRGVVHHAGGHHHQHGAVPPPTAHRAADHGPPPAPEPHRRPGSAVQVVRHAHLH